MVVCVQKFEIFDPKNRKSNN